MSIRKTKFAIEEYYHILNRGADKRNIFLDNKDFERFLCGMKEFNTLDPIGSIHESRIRKKHTFGNLVSKGPLVSFVCYCLNQNHFHFVIKQVADKGIEKFMHRLCLGYSKYFNLKNKRNGVLFQGPYKAIHIDSDSYLLYLSVYVNLNNQVHGLRDTHFYRSSWLEYSDDFQRKETGFCEKDIILNQFSNLDKYKNFAKESLKSIQKRKELEKLLLD